MAMGNRAFLVALAAVAPLTVLGAGEAKAARPEPARSVDDCPAERKATGDAKAVKPEAAKRKAQRRYILM